MCLHMAPKVSWCGKGLEAAMTGMRLLLDVCHPVIVEIGAGGETFSTSFTLVWLFPSMNTSVGVKGGTGGKSLVTIVTGVRPLSCVNSNMSFQQGRTVK